MGRADSSGNQRSKRFQRLVLLIVFAVVTIAVGAVYYMFGGISTVVAEGLPRSSRVVVESISKRVIEGQNHNTRLPMASTTKVMTAYLACISGKLDEIVPIARCAIGVEGSSIYLQEGERLTLRDLTYGLMLQSGNDAAVAIAVYLGGSVEEFAGMMNAKAKELGCNDTNFTNPNGLHDINHYTSAYDLAVITANALDNPDFCAIVSTKLHRIKSNVREDRVIANKNKMLSMYNGAIGVKTGFTKAAGRCLVSAAERDGVRLVSVVLNVGDMWQASMNLLDKGFSKTMCVNVVEKDQELAAIRIPKSDSIMRVAAKDSFDRVLIDGDDAQCEFEIVYDQKLRLPIQKGQNVGELKIFSQNRLIFETKVYSMVDVSAK